MLRGSFFSGRFLRQNYEKHNSLDKLVLGSWLLFREKYKSYVCLWVIYILCYWVLKRDVNTLQFPLYNVLAMKVFPFIFTVSPCSTFFHCFTTLNQTMLTHIIFTFYKYWTQVTKSTREFSTFSFTTFNTDKINHT